MLIQEAKRLQQLAGLSLNEEESKEENVIGDLKNQMSSLISGIEDELEDASKEQKEGLLTTAGIALALPAILGLISRFGKAASGIIRKNFGSKPTQPSETEEYFQKMGKVADDLHHLYMKPLELVVKRFVKDPNKAKKVSHFIFHIIVGIMLLSAGITAVKAIQSKNLSLATLETALSAIKGGEIKQYITKLMV
jgi:hypothetical protein